MVLFPKVSSKSPSPIAYIKETLNVWFFESTIHLVDGFIYCLLMGQDFVKIKTVSLMLWSGHGSETEENVTVNVTSLGDARWKVRFWDLNQLCLVMKGCLKSLFEQIRTNFGRHLTNQMSGKCHLKQCVIMILSLFSCLLVHDRTIVDFQKCTWFVNFYIFLGVCSC